MLECLKRLDAYHQVGDKAVSVSMRQNLQDVVSVLGSLGTSLTKQD